MDSFWDDRVGYVKTLFGQHAGCLACNLVVSIVTILGLKKLVSF